MAEANDIEERLTKAVADLERQFDGTPNLRWNIVRALIHRAVHYATEKPGVEFCALATYLGEMVGHAHKLAHGDNPRAPVHKDFVH
jgi:hypothetical protein